MLTQKTSIQGIPALLWGESSEDLYLFVHGKCSRKEDAAPFAELAVKKGFPFTQSVSAPTFPCSHSRISVLKKSCFFPQFSTWNG